MRYAPCETRTPAGPWWLLAYPCSENDDDDDDDDDDDEREAGRNTTTAASESTGTTQGERHRFAGPDATGACSHAGTYLLTPALRLRIFGVRLHSPNGVIHMYSRSPTAARAPEGKDISITRHGDD